MKGTGDPAAAIVAGKTLVATIDGATLTFDLTGAPSARHVLETCIDAHKTP